MSAEFTERHKRLGAQFTSVNDVPAVNDYGDTSAEYGWLRRSAGVIDLSFRGRLCVAGADRRRFLHGQVTNDINKLKAGQGAYAAITTAKGKMVADANIYCLEDEILLDIEPGISAAVSARLEKYIIADDVEILDVREHYGMAAVLGPKAADVLTAAQLGVGLPAQELEFTQTRNREGGEVYCMRQSHGSAMGFDLFVPVAGFGEVFNQLVDLSRQAGGGPVGWQAIETVRIEAGRPRFRQDMDESNLAPETGIEAQAISYAKGCYIGQEVIARIRTYGQVAKALRGLRFNPGDPLPGHRDRLFFGEKEVGYITSVVASPTMGSVGLGYVRREHNEIGTELTVATERGTLAARIVALPFQSTGSV